jgi:hypothetical protein
MITSRTRRVGKHEGIVASVLSGVRERVTIVIESLLSSATSEALNFTVLDTVPAPLGLT